MLQLGSLDYLKNETVLITGGTGSLGKRLTQLILKHSEARKIVIYSRDEFKQFEMEQSFSPEERLRLRFFLGDVRDRDRLMRAFDGTGYVIHAAALKQVPAAEYNPFEFVKTNVNGAENVIAAAVERDVKGVVALSTDKAANPINLYGATKLCSDKLFVAGNSYSGAHKSRFSVVRYGNVVGSRGSVIPFFLTQRQKALLPITDERMTRFWITLDQGALLVLNALDSMQGGEIFVPKIPSMHVADLARVIAPECKTEIVGIRPGEKLHEIMISEDDARQTLSMESVYVIKPNLDFWKNTKPNPMYRDAETCPEGFAYTSGNNTEWVNDDQLSEMIAGLDLPEAKAWAKERGIQ